MAQNFTSFLNETEEKHTKVQNVSSIKPPIRPLGASGLEKGDIFEIFDIQNNVWIDGKLTKKPENPVYYTKIKMFDNAGNEIGGKKLYFNSLCKTVFKYYQDEFGNVLKDPKEFITTFGDVATKIQKSDNMISALQSLQGTRIIISDIATIVTKNWNDTDGSAPLYTATCYKFDYFNNNNN